MSEVPHFGPNWGKIDGRDPFVCNDCERLKADLARLRLELNHEAYRGDKAREERDAAEARLLALAQARDALHTALRDFGRHRANCPVSGGYTYACTCGLAAALSTPREP